MVLQRSNAKTDTRQPTIEGTKVRASSALSQSSG